MANRYFFYDNKHLVNLYHYSLIVRRRTVFYVSLLKIFGSFYIFFKTALLNGRALAIALSIGSDKR